MPECLRLRFDFHSSPLLRVSVSGVVSANYASFLRYCKVPCYGPVLSVNCPSCCLREEWAKRRTFSWVQAESIDFCELLRYRGRFPWWGSVCSSVPRSPGVTLQRSGAAHGPLHPAVFFSKLCWSCVCYFVGFLESCLGNVKWFVALGLLFCFGCPLSFGPVRSFVFSVLGSLGGGASSQ